MVIVMAQFHDNNDDDDVDDTWLLVKAQSVPSNRPPSPALNVIYR